MYMAMSADASCRGLRTSREGPLVLKLSQGEDVTTILSRVNSYKATIDQVMSRTNRKC